MSVGSRYKADPCESTNANKQKLLNNRCARDECSAYTGWSKKLTPFVLYGIYTP